ncbi:hypothetical protein HFN89_05040 [Rhizobium laguerreae]|nr:hypothetical protein [Rhizobium laguerreae]
MHQFFLSDNEMPKRVARLLKDEFERFDIVFSLSKCRNIVAELYGEKNWKQLESGMGQRPPSPLDHESDDTVVAARRSHQSMVLQGYGIPLDAVQSVLDRTRPTSSRSQRRVEDTSRRLTYLDVTADKFRSFTNEEIDLFSIVFAREQHYPLYQKEIDWNSREGKRFIATGPDARRALSSRLAELNAKTTYAPVMLAAQLIKFQAEPMIWADTIKEMERRLDGTVTLVKWYEQQLLGGYAPSDDGIKEIISLRSASERSVGHPVHRVPIRPGDIGIMVANRDRPPYWFIVPVSALEDAEAAIGEITLLSYPKAIESKDDFIAAQLALFETCVGIEDHPDPTAEEMRDYTAASLLWLAFNHPTEGPRIRAKAMEMATSGRCACVTVFRSEEDGRILTAVDPAFRDLNILNDLPTDDLREIVDRLFTGTKEES